MSETATTDSIASNLFLRCYRQSRNGLVLIPDGEVNLIEQTSNKKYNSDLGDVIHKIAVPSGSYIFQIAAIDCDTLLIDAIEMKSSTSLQLDVVLNKGRGKQKFYAH